MVSKEDYLRSWGGVSVEEVVETILGLSCNVGFSTSVLGVLDYFYRMMDSS